MEKYLLMSYEQYQQLEKTPIPYLYTIRNGDQHLYYFGAQHSFDPSHHQFAILKKFFNDFLTSTQKQERLVLIEGGVPTECAISETEAIVKGGEAQCTHYYAKNANVSISSPELKSQELVNKLLGKYSLDLVAYYFFARTCVQYFRLNRDQEFDSYINIFLNKNLEALAGPYLLPNSKLNLIHEELFQNVLNSNDVAFFQKITNPNGLDTVINEVTRYSSILRDEAVLFEIKKEWHAGKSLFITFGATHAIMQEPAIRFITKK